MQGSRDDSIWKTLAVAFGDGLAFGVGQTAAQRLTGAPAQYPDVRRLASRLGEIEQRIDRARQTNVLPGGANHRIAEAVVAAVDARLREHAANIEQRLAAIEARVTDHATLVDLEMLRSDFNDQMGASLRRADEGASILRNQVTSLHRQFAESMARLVDEQISATMEVRVAPVEKQLKEEIRQQTGRAVSLVASATDEYLTDRIEPLKAETAELRQRVTEADQNTLELVLALGQLCLVTAERLAPGSAGPEPPEAAPEEMPQSAAQSAPDAAPQAAPASILDATVPPPPAAGAAVLDAEIALPATAEPIAMDTIDLKPAPVTLPPVPAAEPETPLAVSDLPAPPAQLAAAEPPLFTQPPAAQKPWRIPMVSSFFVVTGGLLLLHYL